MSMEIKKYLNVTEGFQKSVNLAYDLMDGDKVVDFIPTRAALEILEPLLLSVHPNSTDRAHILVGPYGKGKSHIILVLLALLRCKDTKRFERIMTALLSYNKNLYDFVADYVASKNRLLPVVIQGSSTSLTQSFLYALQVSLRDAGVEDLLPDTHFQAAMNRLNMWEEQYPTTFTAFAEIIKPEPIQQFRIRLAAFDNAAYEKFVEIYPQLTSGGEFNPFIGFDLVELYSNVATALNAVGYKGIFVVYDEFSKYLESNIKNASVSDIKMLQDFAEKCNRSKNQQMHLLLIAHKDIENYIDHLPKNKVDGWRGVSERFTHLEMRSDYGQLYEVIAAALQKTQDFYTDYCAEHEDTICREKAFVKESPLFEGLTRDQRRSVVYGGYPLHPFTTFVLPRLSELVAQNERTLFTFLSSSGKNTLTDIINKRNGLLVSVDAVFDYFEPLLRKEVYTSEVYKIYSLANSVLAKVAHDSLGAKTIKAIALIYIIGQFEKCPPTPEVVVSAFDGIYSQEDVINCLADLETKKLVVYAKRSNGYLRLNTTNPNVHKLVMHYKEQLAIRGSVRQILSEYASDLYLYPTRYNDENAIIRYFDFDFITGTDFLSVNDWESRIAGRLSDGVFFAILPESEADLSSIRSQISSHFSNSRRVIFALPKEYTDISDSVFLYQAVCKLKGEAGEDTSAAADYELYYEDMVEVLDHFVQSFIFPDSDKVDYYYDGEELKISRKSQLSQQLSQICYKVFPDTPKINNETINKNELPANTLNSRSKVVAGLLERELAPTLGLVGSGQDVSIMRSTLSVTGVVDFSVEPPQLHVKDCKDERLKSVLAVISQFFLESGNGERKCFSELFDRLTSSEFGIGMKRGPIPIYIAAVMHELSNSLVISTAGQEIELNAETMNSISAKPEAYYCHLQDWSPEKAKFVHELAELFARHISSKEKELGSYGYVVKAMQRWFISLPKYAKEAKAFYRGKGNYAQLTKAQTKFSNSLKATTINPYEYLFITLPKIFGHASFDDGLLKDIKQTKASYDVARDNLIDGLSVDLLDIFSPNAVAGVSIMSAVSDWYSALKDQTKAHVFDGCGALLMAQISKDYPDGKDLVISLAKPATGLRIEDWDNSTVTTFNVTLSELKKDVSAYDRIENDEGAASLNAYILTTIDMNGKQKERTFGRVEYSKMAKLLKNEIMNSLDEMGQAISDSEKRQVLIEALESLC